MRSLMALGIAGSLTAGVLAAGGVVYSPVDESVAGVDMPWLRTAESDDRVLRMEVATRRFVRAEGGPVLTVVGAVHIGESSYYETLQSHLDVKDLILFEGVSPGGAERDIPETDAGKQKRTEDRLRLIGILATNVNEVNAVDREAVPEYVHAAEGLASGPVESVDDLRRVFAEKPRQREWVEVASLDAWGRPVVYEVTRDDNGEPTGFDVVSFGADGEPGGAGRNADLRLSDQPELTDAELGRVDGVQVKLARALGLKFQLSEMDESGEQWRNSDMTFASINERIEERGGGDSMVLLDSIQGSGLPFQLISMVLGIVETVPGLQPRAKMMIMEMLSQTDIGAAGGAMGEGGDAFFEVIIEDRNQVVMDDLASALAEDDASGWEEIGIIYGAGHLPDLTERLEEQLGYVPVEEAWIPAMTLDLDRAGISRRERLMVRLQVRQAVKQLESR